MPRKSLNDTVTVLGSISTKTLDTLDTTVTSTSQQLEQALLPVRESFAARYPTLFSLLATFGVATTFLGFEQLLLSSQLLQQYPLLIFSLGVSILALTGTLYKKLK
jgi:hypothetical protein